MKLIIVVPIFTFIHFYLKFSIAQTNLPNPDTEWTAANFPRICDSGNGDKCKNDNGQFKYICDPNEKLLDKKKINDALRILNDSPRYASSKVYLAIAGKIIPVSETVDEFAGKLLINWMRGVSGGVSRDYCKDIGAVVVIKCGSDDSPELISSIFVRDTDVHLRDLLENAPARLDSYGYLPSDDPKSETREIENYLNELLGDVSFRLKDQPLIESPFNVTAYRKPTPGKAVVVSTVSMGIYWVVVGVGVFLGWFFSRRPKLPAKNQSGQPIVGSKRSRRV